MLSKQNTSYQARVHAWMLACFTPEITADVVERNDRFTEEALELVQANGYTAERAHALVDYVFNRPVGEPDQEVGGVMVTLAALCNAAQLDMMAAALREIERIEDPGIMAKIKAKQAAKPTGSALPIAARAEGRPTDDAALVKGEATGWEVLPKFMEGDGALAARGAGQGEASGWRPDREAIEAVFDGRNVGLNGTDYARGWDDAVRNCRADVIAIVSTGDEAATPEAPEGWVLVPRDPSRKLVEDLAHEWAYDVEEACESYQGFLGVCAKHGLAGSDPGAYEAAPPPPPVAETSADVVRLVKAARKAYRSVDPKDISDLPLVNELGAAVSAFDDCVPWERPASRAPTDTGEGR